MNYVLPIQECPSCGSKEIKKVTEDWTGEYGGKKYIVPSLEYYACPACGEKVYDKDAMKRIQEHSPALKNKSRKKAA